MSARAVAQLFGALYVATGAFGVGLSARLVILHAEDRGIVKMTDDPKMLVVADKMVRIALNRFLVCMFILFCGTLAVLPSDVPSQPSASKLTARGAMFLIALAITGISQVAASWWDLKDRELINA